jgi:type II secretory pathway component GspD/PulD (secretin)
MRAFLAHFRRLLGDAMKSSKLLACASFAALIMAGASPARSAQEKPVVPKAEPKRLAVSIQNQSWKKVLEWLADETHLPIISSQIPTGTFTCVSPAGASYTLPEVFDLVNEGLMAAKFRLQRGPASLKLLPADERIDPALVPTVRPEDLPTRGRTEFVRVVYSLKVLKAQELVPELKRLLGPFGEIGTLANRLVLQDTAQNVRQVLKTLQELDGQAPVGSAAPIVKAYPVRDVEALTKTLQAIFRNTPGVRITGTSSGIILVWGSAQDHEQVVNLLNWVGTSPTSKITELISLGTLQAARTVKTLKAMFGDRGGPYLEADASRNAIIVRGTPEQIQEIKAVLRPLGEAPAAATMRIITLESGSAAALAEALQNLIREMRPNPVRVIAPGEKSDPIPKTPARDGDNAQSRGVGGTRGAIGSGDTSSIEARAEILFRRLDKNGDGVLSDDELPADSTSRITTGNVPLPEIPDAFIDVE